ncbi:MAG: hypothetical protein ACLQQ0_15870, partial [Limisphaerales bacterium]
MKAKLNLIVESMVGRRCRAAGHDGRSSAALPQLRAEIKKTRIENEKREIWERRRLAGLLRCAGPPRGGTPARPGRP